MPEITSEYEESVLNKHEELIGVANSLAKELEMGVVNFGTEEESDEALGDGEAAMAFERAVDNEKSLTEGLDLVRSQIDGIYQESGHVIHDAALSENEAREKTK
jgi:hypothetical protein